MASSQHCTEGSRGVTSTSGVPLHVRVATICSPFHQGATAELCALWPIVTSAAGDTRTRFCVAFFMSLVHTRAAAMRHMYLSSLLRL